MLLAWSPLYVPHVGAGLPSRLSLRRTHPRGGDLGRHFSLTVNGASLRHETTAVDTLLLPIAGANLTKQPCQSAGTALRGALSSPAAAGRGPLLAQPSCPPNAVDAVVPTGVWTV